MVITKSLERLKNNKKTRLILSLLYIAIVSIIVVIPSLISIVDRQDKLNNITKEINATMLTKADKNISILNTSKIDEKYARDIFLDISEFCVLSGIKVNPKYDVMPSKYVDYFTLNITFLSAVKPLTSIFSDANGSVNEAKRDAAFIDFLSLLGRVELYNRGELILDVKNVSQTNLNLKGKTNVKN